MPDLSKSKFNTSSLSGSKVFSLEVVLQELEEEIIEVFTREPGRQPQAMVHFDCGGGRLSEEWPKAIDSINVPGRNLHILTNCSIKPDRAGPMNETLRVLANGHPADCLNQREQIEKVSVLNSWQQHLRAIAEQLDDRRLFMVEVHAEAAMQSIGSQRSEE